MVDFPKMNILVLFALALTAACEEDYGLDSEKYWISEDFAQLAGLLPIHDEALSSVDQLIKRDGLLSYLFVDPQTGETYAPVQSPTKEIPEWEEVVSETSQDPVEPQEFPSSELPSELYPETSSHAPDNEKDPILVGSIRGIPGIHFPDYMDIPLTSFSCWDQKYIPGFYADLETGCQVFHVCWSHRKESFLCPVGTTFNQAILACDYWYSSNCSLAAYYYDVNAASTVTGLDENVEDSHIGSIIETLVEPSQSTTGTSSTTEQAEVFSEQPTMSDLSYIMKFLPVKAKVTVYTEGKTEGKTRIVAEASVGKQARPCKDKRKTTCEEQVDPEDHKTLEPEVTERPVYPEIQPSTRKPVYPGTKPSTRKPVVTEKPVYPGTQPSTRKPVVTERPVYPGTQPSTRKPVVTERPVYPGTKPSTHKPVVTERPVYPEVQPSTRGPVVTRRPVQPKKPSILEHVVKTKPIDHQKKMERHPVHGGIDASASRIIDQVFDLAKKIVKEVGDFVPRTRGFEKNRRTPVEHKRVPLTKLNPKFIVKPAVEAEALPVQQLATEKSVKKQKKVLHQTMSTAKLDEMKGFKPVFLPLKKLNMGLQVSPLTKKALTKNYLRLWKTKAK